MTQTVLLVGQINREIELFRARLEREHFSVSHCETERCAYDQLKTGYVQSVLFTHNCSRTLIERILARLRANKKTRYLPVILITDSDPPAPLQSIRGIAETFRLHEIPLREAAQRLRLAIRLTQLVKYKVA